MMSAPWGGSEELWSQAAVRLQRAGHTARAIVPYRGEISEKFQALSRQGVQLGTYPTPSFIEGAMRYNLDRLSLRTRRTYVSLKKFSPDLVIISQGEIAGGLEWARVCREAGIPYALMVHCNSDLLWFRNDEIESVRQAYVHARKVFCVSRANLELLRLQVGDLLANGEVVWNPYSVPPAVVPEWPCESNGWRMACVARLDAAAKGQDILLQLLSKPEWRERPVELSFFGEGYHEAALRQIAQALRLTSVHFRGHVNDVRAIWEENHILLQPSRYEGVPMTVMESMLCGRPAVVTDVGRTSELYVDNETGFIAQAATLASFGEAMERAWQRRKDWPLMGQAARARAETLIPKDPVGMFCEILVDAATTTAPAALTS